MVCWPAKEEVYSRPERCMQRDREVEGRTPKIYDSRREVCGRHSFQSLSTVPNDKYKGVLNADIEEGFPYFDLNLR